MLTNNDNETGGRDSQIPNKPTSITAPRDLGEASEPPQSDTQYSGDSFGESTSASGRSGTPDNVFKPSLDNTSPPFICFVGNLWPGTQETDVKTFMEQNGIDPLNVRLIVGPKCTKRRYGYVDFATFEDMTRALALDGTETAAPHDLQEGGVPKVRPIRVDRASARTPAQVSKFTERTATQGGYTNHYHPTLVNHNPTHTQYNTQNHWRSYRGGYHNHHSYTNTQHEQHANAYLPQQFEAHTQQTHAHAHNTENSTNNVQAATTPAGAQAHQQFFAPQPAHTQQYMYVPFPAAQSLLNVPYPAGTAGYRTVGAPPMSHTPTETTQSSNDEVYANSTSCASSGSVYACSEGEPSINTRSGTPSHVVKPSLQEQKPPYICFFGNLFPGTTEDNVLSFLKTYGIFPTNVRLIVRQKSAKRRYGYVDFSTFEDMQKALSLNGTDTSLCQSSSQEGEGQARPLRPLRVDRASPRTSDQVSKFDDRPTHPKTQRPNHGNSYSSRQRTYNTPTNWSGRRNNHSRNRSRHTKKYSRNQHQNNQQFTQTHNLPPCNHPNPCSPSVYFHHHPQVKVAPPPQPPPVAVPTEQLLAEQERFGDYQNYTTVPPSPHTPTTVASDQMYNAAAQNQQLYNAAYHHMVSAPQTPTCAMGEHQHQMFNPHAYAGFVSPPQTPTGTAGGFVYDAATVAAANQWNYQMPYYSAYVPYPATPTGAMSPGMHQAHAQSPYYYGVPMYTE